MYGRPSRHRPSGGGWRQPSQPHQQPQPVDPNHFALQNPFLQNHLYQLNYQQQSFNNMAPPNSFFPLQNPIPNPNPNPNFSSFQNPSSIQNPPLQSHENPSQSHQNPKVPVEKVDRAVRKARKDLLAAGEHVSAWKVSQSALVTLKVDSWGSLSLQMQQVPSLHSLMVIEGKINAFIHCFVGVRRVTTLYDLELATCNNEGIEKFEELELGPLLQHPLVLHYFSVNSDTNEVFHITSEEIINLLSKFLIIGRKKNDFKVEVEEFLEFIARNKSAVGKEMLGIRIQSLGMHIGAIRGAERLEHKILKKYKDDKKEIFLMQKKELNERFSAITQRVESFSSAHKDFCGKHIRFVASSSGDEENYDYTYEDDNGHINSPSQSPKSADRVSKCPYPSLNEEIRRLGLKGEIHGQTSQACVSPKLNRISRSARLKRKSDNLNASGSPKLQKQKVEADVCSLDNNCECKELDGIDSTDLSVSDNSLRMFVTTWKEACHRYNAAEVLEKMLQFYGRKLKRKRIKTMFSSHPFIGLLNVAISSIKCGMWDSIYDALQSVSVLDLSITPVDKGSKYESISVEPNLTGGPRATERRIEHRLSVPVEDIIRNIAAYFELDHRIQTSEKSDLEKRLIFLRKLYDCEHWLVEKFNVEEFRSLGYGDFIPFLEKHSSLLPQQSIILLTGETSRKWPLEACMFHHHLVDLASQASNNLWENEKITTANILLLLRRQFPSIGFKVIENGPVEDFLSIVAKHKNDVISKSLIFSASLSGTNYAVDISSHSESGMLEHSLVRLSSSEKATIYETVTSKDAIEVLLKAPMLSDLSLWSHWDLKFAPSLGPLVPWLLNEVKTDELLCLFTKDGRIIRLDHSATVDSFLEAAIQGSSFQTAVKLLSLFSIVGGERNVPVSLLKCHAQRAFEVMSRNLLDSIQSNGRGIPFNYGKICREDMIGEITSCNDGGGLQNNLGEMNVAVSTMSRFVLECLQYLPAEFRGFVANILLFGMRSIVKNAPSVILSECSQTEQRVMLHEVGLSIGVLGWIDDFVSFSSGNTTDLVPSGALCSMAVTSQKCSDIEYKQDMSDKCFTSEETVLESVLVPEYTQLHTEVSAGINNAEVSDAKKGSCYIQQLSDCTEDEDAALVIESIRRDEFGLDPSFSYVESSMLKKQHARLGRALHCLSQELYSQDSHFLLELVQNADDNTYSESVEPTLIFILQRSGIVVLNNEQGFTAQNIRALCDVGNSTKKGSNAGYIGQKGIGFKSVFRVTDAPEIHSNGFHVKFDISEGQIGFVLPSIVPPCNLDFFNRLASGASNQRNCNWNTCIVLPFRSRLQEGTALKVIMTMFSDLHPSLLLFLHRLQCIKFRNLIDDSSIVMRKEIVGNGIIRVSHGKDKMTWLVVSQKLRAELIRHDVKTTEISIAFTLQETDDNGYSPYLHQQPVFAFLPLRTYGMRFILQGDFVLPSSREEVDGDSPWNQWLLSEFPALFVNAEKSFCALPCFRDHPGKALAAFMSFVPLVGEVQGFFSSLPRLIISKLRMSNCLLVEGSNNEWVPPCKVLRGWNEQARSLLPDSLLREHLGLGFLDRYIVLSDALASSLGVEEYGPEVLLQMLSSLCQTKNGLISMGMGWLSSFLIALDMMLVHYLMQSSLDCEAGFDFMKDLQRIQFIPLSNGTYAALNEGTIWLHDDIINTGIDGEKGVQYFPNLYSRLRIVNPALLLESSLDSSHVDLTVIDKLTKFFYKIGVQRLSAHEIIKLHILPTISDQRITCRDDDLMTEYICFVMFHLQSSCHGCRDEREYIISELRNRAYILTNNGFKQLAEVSIHFSNEFGNRVNINKLVNIVDVKWYEIDISYLRHPISKSITSAPTKWREFFQELGITDFVKVVQVEKSLGEMFNSFLKDSMSEIDMISPGSSAKDWESLELVNLLSLLSRDQNRNACQYLLEVLDMLWDTCFSDKAIGYYTSTSTSDRKPFKSSFMSSICDVPWIVSTMDNELHCPKDIFHGCDEVHSILGTSAPYAVPKVQSAKLVSDIGFKTRVTLEDAIGILKVWKSFEIPFKASVAQMSKLYTFIWNEIAVSKKKLAEELYSMPFIFVPYTSGSTHEDLVSGMFFSCGEVCWHDSTGCMSQMKIHTPGSSTGLSDHPLNKTLCSFYPSLHDFFVHGCGVRENPPLCDYLQILLQLSSAVLPSQAANAVFQVFLKWTDGLKSGMSSEDVAYLKESLKKKEFTVLPTVQDKWVSLHSCFGLVCWCDEKKLKKQFKHLDGIDFLYFGELSKNDKEVLRTSVSILMKTLGIPALSEIVSREPIYYGVGDPTFKASLVDWALPYAQRYLYSMHPDKYSELKQSGFDFLSLLRVVVVEKLFYINVIKSCGSASEKRVECSCLLHGNYLYSTPESDVHAIFMELSCLFFNNPDLHFSNFLHMITTMAESGSTEDQTELFILNTQKISKLPDGQSVWALSSVSTSTEKADSLETNLDPAEANDKSFSKSKKKSGNSNWPPVDWKTAPGFGYARANGFQMQAPTAQANNDLPKKEEGDYQVITKIDMATPIPFDKDWAIEDEPVPMPTAPVFPDSNDLLGYCSLAYNEADYGMNGELGAIGSDHISENAEFGSSNFSNRVQLRFGTPDAKEAMLTGRLGEHIAFKYFVGKAGKIVVRWVNEDSETGLPYDIVIGEKEGCKEFVEVKSTKSPRKDWFLISMREWQFAIEKGEAFSIARVALLGNKVARVSVFKNPAKLCQQGKLQLAMMMPKKQNEFAIVS